MKRTLMLALVFAFVPTIFAQDSTIRSYGSIGNLDYHITTYQYNDHSTSMGFIGRDFVYGMTYYPRPVISAYPDASYWKSYYADYLTGSQGSFLPSGIPAGYVAPSPITEIPAHPGYATYSEYLSSLYSGPGH